MSKTLRTTLVLAILISAAANAPGLLLALGNSQPAAPADAKAGSSVAPVDYYAYDYDYDTTPSDPGEWLDALFEASNDASVARWRHTWTDFEAAPAADALNPYRRPAQWEPEGVLFAYLSTFSDIGYTDLREDFSSPVSHSVRSVWSTGFGAGSVVPGNNNEEGQGAEVPEDEPGPAPEDNPPPPDDVTPVTPVPDQPDTEPQPPVSVPEPAPLGLFALGLAGLFLFQKRRHVSALARGNRDRA